MWSEYSMDTRQVIRRATILWMVFGCFCVALVSGAPGERIASAWDTIRNVEISGDQVVWAQGSGVIFLFRPYRIVRYDIPRKELVNVTAQDEKYVSYLEPSVSAARIIWRNGEYLGGQVSLLDIPSNMSMVLTSENADQPRISGEYVAWENIGNYQMEFEPGEIVLDAPPRIRNITYLDLPSLTVRNLRTGEEHRIPLHSHTNDRTLSLDGSLLAWDDPVNGTWRVFLHEFGTDSTRQVTDGPRSQRAPHISGDWMVWEDIRNNGDIVLQHLPTGTVKSIAEGLETQVSPRISGDRVIWLEGTGENRTIRLYDLFTGETIAVANISSWKADCQISWDRVVYLTHNKSTHQDEVYLVTLPARKVAEIPPTTTVLRTTTIPTPGFTAIVALAGIAMILGVRRWRRLRP